MVRTVAYIVSFVIWERGGGVRPPNVPTEKYTRTCNLYARVSASETYILKSQNFTSAYIYNQCSSFFITYGMGLETTVYQQNTNIEKIYVYASGANELRKFSHFTLTCT